MEASARVPKWFHPVRKFWNRHVNITIEEGAHRDHLGMIRSFLTLIFTASNVSSALERTFLGYLRTSLILVMTGVLTAQLFRLQHAANPNQHFGFYVVGRPLSIMFIGMAIVVVLVGAYRFWKLQNALIRGKAYTGGWEVLLIMILSILVSGVAVFLWNMKGTDCLYSWLRPRLRWSLVSISTKPWMRKVESQAPTSLAGSLPRSYL